MHQTFLGGFFSEMIAELLRERLCDGSWKRPPIRGVAGVVQGAVPQTHRSNKKNPGTPIIYDAKMKRCLIVKVR